VADLWETLMLGRRVASFDEIERPGDYFGPTDEVDGDGNATGRRGVWFLLPIADPVDPMRRDHSSREAWARTRANGLHRVSEPPWSFRECDDGSIEIRASIACGGADPEGEYWHGYLDEGHQWRTC